jgi:hypothetical protein
MESVSSSETSVKFYNATRRHIPDDNVLHIHRCEDLKSNISQICVTYECAVSGRRAKQPSIYDDAIMLGKQILSWACQGTPRAYGGKVASYSDNPV